MTTLLPPSGPIPTVMLQLRGSTLVLNLAAYLTVRISKQTIGTSLQTLSLVRTIKIEADGCPILTILTVMLNIN